MTQVAEKLEKAARDCLVHIIITMRMDIRPARADQGYLAHITHMIMLVIRPENQDQICLAEETSMTKMDIRQDIPARDFLKVIIITMSKQKEAVDSASFLCFQIPNCKNFSILTNVKPK